MRATILAATVAAAALATARAGAIADDDVATVQRGRYLAAIMDCGGCHTTGVLLGQPDPTHYVAGSDVGFGIPDLGVFYPPNLTPDPETGLGRWTADEMIAAIRTGTRPDGRILAPVMPYHSYAALTDDDATALVAFLRSLEPVVHQVPRPSGPNEPATAPYMAVIMPH